MKAQGLFLTGSGICCTGMRILELRFCPNLGCGSEKVQDQMEYWPPYLLSRSFQKAGPQK